MKVRLAVGALFGCLVADAARAGTVRLEGTVEGVNNRAPSAVELVVEAVSDAHLPQRFVTRFLLGRDAKLELPTGRWRLRALAEGYWAPDQWLEVTGDQSTQVTLRIWRTSTVFGSILADGDRPSEIRLAFGPTPEPHGPLAAQPKGYASCEMRSERFSCEVPIGSMDLRVGATGFAPHYRWAFKVTSSASANVLGPIRLARGGSVTGYVERPAGRVASACRVEVLDLDGAHLLGRGTDRQPRPGVETRYPFSARTNERGFFQIVGLAAGDYRVVAASVDTGETAGTGVSITESEETRLSNVLVLGTAATLTLSVDPAEPPFGGVWVVSLLNLSTKPALEEARTAVLRNGTVRVDALAAGDYLLSILTSEDRPTRPGSEQRWYAERIHLEPDSGPLHVDLALVNVEGRVRLGTKPLPAWVGFGGFTGAQSIVVRSDEKGEFRTVLPKKDRWRIDVRCDEPPVTRSIRNIDVVFSSDTEGTVDIQLADTVIRGHVVDGDGKPAGGAIVSVLPFAPGRSERPAQTHTDASGAFEFRGLPAGQLYVSASFGDSSTPILEVTMTEVPTDVRLELQPLLTVNARAVSLPEGAPLAGAFIRAVPTDYPLLVAPIVRADADGRIRLSFPAPTREATATFGAPGRPLAMTRFPLKRDGDLVLGIPHASGNLIVEFDEPVDPWDASGPPIVLTSGGATVNLSLLLSLAGIRRTGATDRVSLPLQEGSYSVCIASRVKPVAGTGQARCSSGYLSPPNELVVRLDTRAVGSRP